LPSLLFRASVCAALSEDNSAALAPVLIKGDQGPLHLGREMAQHLLVGGMDAQRRRNEVKQRRLIRKFHAAKITVP